MRLTQSFLLLSSIREGFSIFFIWQSFETARRPITIEGLTVHLKSNLSAAPKAAHVFIYFNAKCKCEWKLRQEYCNPRVNLSVFGCQKRGVGGFRGRPGVITVTRVH